MIPEPGPPYSHRWRLPCAGITLCASQHYETDMSQIHTQSIDRDKFLTMAANLMFKAFLEPSRTQAKALYRTIEEGKAVHLTDVQMEDKSTVGFEVALDHSELKGKLNYGAFRASVATLVHNLGETLRQEDAEIPVFTADDNPEVKIFGVTAVTYEGKDPRVMVLGADQGSGRPVIQLRLMYLDPVQFQQGSGESGPVA